MCFQKNLLSVIGYRKNLKFKFVSIKNTLESMDIEEYYYYFIKEAMSGFQSWKGEM